MSDDEEVKYCSVCGNELSEPEIENGQDICDDCQASMVLNPDVYPNQEDFLL